ncbi:hypothetical protein E2562_024774 [Oryza meyeriana var. granulata]|uniref:EGF-like calcium-binding domain-containing protein n=1 Tax=Oryza meyeriana var. granulata TaxID=110450 RepID=A0A6G1E1F9_9ORYZ|nr:hypothetical protein E2562_024774 [Oryza meyeriana var. granulata]
MEKVDNIKIFSKDDLKKITKNNSEVLGQGGFGKVYKGTLEDNTFVAVKTSIEKAYDQENSGRAMFDMSIAIEENIFMLEEIGNGYEGNPYDDDPDKGCKDINECSPSNKDKYPCYGICNNIPGDYECKCRSGYQRSGEGPKKQECSPKFPIAARIALDKY